ncbi:hypothetical protein BCV69DRAFT_208620 [Microstroma glucosiphilum]|uniref:Uncharacterized protein n=1 Tax=Pseudomicrostroma glucosiphilum TaxID=1684307 RepID=A0A316U5C3_9BASI|nr:hypothetical protein BCV69DRAFT_208620 [Pseudomicrostroma glucosiphilum]PWN20400.1 hypothetical protein BCV69DRAFT_208620 [Pseudomicrostroma glucosiphilum]
MPEHITLPLPSLLRSSFPPYDAQAARAAQEVLDRNHQTYHVFFNERGLHNHAAHHILAALQLGCAPSSFAQHLEKAEEYLLNPDWKLHRNPKDQGAKGSIEQHNWTEHLGKHDWYWHYLAFFESQIKEKGGAACLEEFVFGEKANEKQVAMLGRFIGGALHPFIHTGYGFEFGLDGIVAEGLAMTAMTEPRFAAVLPPRPTGDKTASTSNSGTTANGLKTDEPLSVFSILSLAYVDKRLDISHHSDDDKFAPLLEPQAAALLNEYTSRWHISEDDVGHPDLLTIRGGSAGKWTELIWVVVLLLGATSRPGKQLRHDFFLMHAHNATLFLPSLLPQLTIASRIKLLDALWRTIFTYWVARGRPVFYIEGTLLESTTEPVKPTAAQHNDEHAAKALRSLIHYAEHLSHTPAGTFSLPSGIKDAVQGREVFPGLEKLDGTAFIRTAGQLLQNQGWPGEEKENWDFEGLGYDEAWQSG